MPTTAIPEGEPFSLLEKWNISPVWKHSRGRAKYTVSRTSPTYYGGVHNSQIPYCVLLMFDGGECVLHSAVAPGAPQAPRGLLFPRSLVLPVQPVHSTVSGCGV